MGGILSRKEDGDEGGDGTAEAAGAGDALLAGISTAAGAAAADPLLPRRSPDDDDPRGGCGQACSDPPRQRKDGGEEEGGPGRGTGDRKRRPPPASLPLSGRERRRDRRKARRLALLAEGGEAAPSAPRDQPQVEVAVVPLELEGRPVAGSIGDSYVRMIRPYPYTFTSHAKKRWVGRAVLDVYAEEFQSYPVSYYERCLEDGRITVNGSVVPTSYRIRGGDVLRHLVHRHEPAVRVSRGGPPLVRVVAETADCLAVDKPPCLPIHPCGGYNENSLQRILEGDMREREREHGGGHQQLRRHDDGDGQLRMVHRLDRLTSGLVVLAKSSRSASRWTDAIRSRDGCQKLYLARVRGRFPDHLATAARQRASPPGEARQPPRPPRLAAEDRGGSSSPRLPDHGEWPDGEIGQEEPATEGSALRRRAANGWWISDALGVPVSNAPPELWPPSSSSDSDRDPTEERLGEILKVLSEQFASSSSGSQSGPAAGVGDAAERPAESDGKQPRPFYWVHLACAIRIVDPKVGAYECGPFDGLDDAEHARTVKPAQTSFCALSYHPESDSTLVLCRPQTGRTHQIRLHLLRLGHPIANDPNYGGDAWYYDAPGREACRRAQALLDADGSGDNSNIGSSESTDPPPSSLVTSDEPATEREMEACAGLPPRADGEPVEAFLARTCVWCRRNASGRQDRAALELLVRSSGIWLHALQYSARLAPEEGSPSGAGEVVAYRTPLPAWSTLGASDGRSAEATCDNRQRRRSDDLSIAMNDSR